MNICIFEDDESVDRILPALVEDGLVAIEGSRLQVRDKMDEIRLAIARDDLRNYSAVCTFYHPYCEVGFPFDATRFRLDEARDIALRCFEEYLHRTGKIKALADIGWFGAEG
ncbi:hypothetical protein [Lysobacter sp. CA199]|uniref:hypothetical protein n=1 Tax=Lysobacter sp. CA199 TaxID=3455608 RepID=UPI003F8CFA3B